MRHVRFAAAAMMLGSLACGGSTAPVVPPVTPPTGTGVPLLVATVPIPASYGIHDTFVRDGLAFVSAWNTGLIIYDVGDGRASGTPAAPVELGRVVTTVTNTTRTSPSTHNAWWFQNPVTGEKKYLFVGEEGPGSIGRSSSGDIHVIDVSNLRAPVEVARFHMPATGTGATDSAGTHNFWMDEAAQVLYAAYYNRGIVAIDVSGTLTGDISNRLLAQWQPAAGSAYTWGVMLANNSIYASDMLGGLYQLRRTGGTIATISGGGNVGERYTSDLWVLDNVAYTGTWGGAQRSQGVDGNALKVWRLSAGGAPTLADSVTFELSGTVSDVEVTPDGKYLLATLERGAQSGFEVYSLADRFKPVRIAKVVVPTGVHTGTFATIGGRRYVFMAKNPGSPALLVYDVTTLTP